MASSFLTAYRYDVPISGMLADAGQDEGVFMAPSLPSVPVAPEDFSGSVWSMPIAAYLGDSRFITTDALKRAPDAPFAMPYGQHQPTRTNYECEERGAKWFVAGREAARYRFPMGAHQTQATFHRRTGLIAYEYDIMRNTVFATGNWPDVDCGALPGGGQIDWDTAGSTPTNDGMRIQEAIRIASGVNADLGILTHDVAFALRLHPETLNVIGTIGQGLTRVENTMAPLDMTLELYRQRWGLQKLIALDGLYNSAAPLAAVSVAEIATAQVWFGCMRGMDGAQMVKGGAVLGTGPVSFAIIREAPVDEEGNAIGLPDGSIFAGARWTSSDPPGEYGAFSNSYAVCRPDDMVNTAYLMTGVV